MLWLILLFCISSMSAMDDAPAGHFNPMDWHDMSRFKFIKECFHSIESFFNDYKKSPGVSDVFAEIIVQIYEKELSILHFIRMYEFIPGVYMNKIQTMLYEYNKMKLYLMWK